MNQQREGGCIAFEGFRRIAAGDVGRVAVMAKAVVDRQGLVPVLIYDDTTGQLIEVDFRGTADDVLRRITDMVAQEVSARSLASSEAASGSTSPDQPGRRGVGRPRLGVVAREVTLLPRHWDWLNGQPGGASVALRKLVEQARRDNEGKDRVRLSQEAANRFMTSMAGDMAGYEEATRALFSGNRDRFDELVEPWPADVRDFAKKLAAVALGDSCDAG